jgi:hypothetical protein
LHDLRHTFGTQAIRAFKIHEVQRMMGHRHITTTERYLHYAPDSDAAAKLTALWGGADSEEETNVVSRCAEPPDSVKEGRKEGRAARLRPSFCAVLIPIKGSLWGALACSDVLGSDALDRKPDDLQLVCIEATTGLEPV